MDLGIDPLLKMWVSFGAMGLMVFSALLITFARLKTKGVVKLILSIIAFILLIVSVFYGFIIIVG